jgi:hypothetical protein
LGFGDLTGAAPSPDNGGLVSFDTRLSAAPVSSGLLAALDLISVVTIDHPFQPQNQTRQ